MPGSPAAKAGLKPGDVINAMTFLAAEAAKGSRRRRRVDRTEPEPIEFDDESPDWAFAFWLLQVLPRQAVELTVNNVEQADHDHAPSPTRTGIYPLRGLAVPGLIRQLPPQTVGVGAAAGLRRHGRQHPEHLRHVPQPGAAAGSARRRWAGRS